MKLNLFLFLFIFFSKFTFATENVVDPNLIHKNLRCLVCQGQSISDSNSDFAQTIKLVVKDLMIIQKFVGPLSSDDYNNIIKIIE